MAIDNQFGSVPTFTNWMSLFKDIDSNRGNLFNSTVFAKPRDVSSYDVLADQVARNTRAQMEAHLLRAAQQQATRGIAAFSGQSGLGFASPLLNQLYRSDYTRGIVQNMIGQHGGYEALQDFMGSSASFAAARGAHVGGVMTPRLLADNARFTAAIASGIYGGSFNAQGVLDTGRTGGLSLGQTFGIAKGILSRRENYDAWARTETARIGTGEAGTSLSLSEIQSFRDGTGASKSARDSFVKYINEFAAELNKSVASVAKLTGSVEDAIGYLQQATRGRLYSNDAQSTAIRNRAVQTAMNLRAIAADAGIGADKLYSMSYVVNDNVQRISDLDGSTAIGSLSAAGFGKWLARNRGASDESRAAAQSAFTARAEDFARGDVHGDMSVAAAYLVETGALSRKDAMALMSSGNGTRIRRELAQRVGGDRKLRKLLDSRRFLNGVVSRNAELVSDLRTTAFTEGYANEQIMRGGARLLDESTAASAIVISGTIADPTARSGFDREFAALQQKSREAERLVSASGLSGEKAAAIIRDAKSGGWDTQDILAAIESSGGDVMGALAGASAAQTTGLAELAKKYGISGNDVVKNSLNALNGLYGRVYKVDTSAARKRTLTRLVSERLSHDQAARFDAYRDEKDASKRSGLSKELLSLGRAAARGEGVYGLSGETAEGNPLFIDELLRGAISVTGDEAKIRHMQNARSQFYERKDAGLSDAEAYMAVEETLVKNGVAKKGALTSADAREKALQRLVETGAYTEVAKRMAGSGKLWIDGAEQSASTLTALLRLSIDENRKKNGNLGLNELLAKSVKGVLGRAFDDGTPGKVAAQLTDADIAKIIDDRTVGTLEDILRIDASSIAESDNPEVRKLREEIESENKVAIELEALTESYDPATREQIVGSSAGGTDMARYRSSVQTGSTTLDLVSARGQEHVSGSRIAARVARADAKSASEAGKLLTTSNSGILKRLYSENNIQAGADAVGSAVDELVSRLTGITDNSGAFDVNGDNSVSEGELGSAITKILQGTEDRSDANLLKILDERGDIGGTLKKSVQDLQGKLGLPVESILSVMAAGAGEEDPANRRGQRETRLLEQRAFADDTSNPIVREVIRLLTSMLSSLETIEKKNTLNSISQ